MHIISNLSKINISENKITHLTYQEWCRTQKSNPVLVMLVVVYIRLLGQF